MNRALFVCLVAIVSCFLAGCGQTTVIGNITLDGTPLSKGDISFTPVSEGSVLTGQIDSSGNYQLRLGTGTAIPTGSYRVKIVAVEPVAPTRENPEPLPKLLTPARYGDVSTSGLTADVKAGPNKFDFKLSSMP